MLNTSIKDDYVLENYIFNRFGNIQMLYSKVIFLSYENIPIMCEIYIDVCVCVIRLSDLSNLYKYSI